MSKTRSRHYQQRVTEALATPRLQDTLHRFADAYLHAREAAFAGMDFEALRAGIAAMKDEVRGRREEYLAQFTCNAGAAVFVDGPHPLAWSGNLEGRREVGH